MMSMNKKQPLRYNISSWSQLPQCMSNNSRQLHIHVTEIIQDTRVQGTLIQVKHEDFGVLFAYLVGAYGPLLSPDAVTYLPELTTVEILSELRRFGFYVTYDPQSRLDGDQLQYLMKLKSFGYDKLRKLNVYSYNNQGQKEIKPVVVAFNVDKNSIWIDNGYSASESEYVEALKNGSAMNVSGMSEFNKFRWDWLTYVANIQDILIDNM